MELSNEIKNFIQSPDTLDFIVRSSDYLDEFIKENPYNFNEEEINVTKDFKKHVKSNFLMIVGFILKFLLKMENFIW